MAERESAPTPGVDAAAVRRAAERIRGRVRRTPVLELVGAESGLRRWSVVLKLEQLQITGSFKVRGALNALLSLPREALKLGVVTASGGNHGLGVAWAARALGVPATVFLPETAPAAKRGRLRALGAEVRAVGPEYEAAAAAAREAAERAGRPYVHAYADAPVIAGQGTVGLEFLTDAPGLDYLLVAVGGGGLIAGIAAYAVEASPGTRVIGVEPVGIPTLHSALAAGAPVRLERLASIAADALGAREVGALNHAIASRAVERVALVEDEAIRAAQALLWDEARLAVEPGGAAAVAALISGAAEAPHGARVGIVLCGANVSLPAPWGEAEP